MKRRPGTLGLALGPDPEPLTRRLLGTRLRLHVLVRAAAAAVMVVGAFVGRELVGVRDLDVEGLVWLAVAIAAYDVAAWWLARPGPTPASPAVRYRRLHAVMLGTILLDFLALTVAIWLVGGARSPFLAFYLLHVILAGLLLSRGEALLATLLAWGLLAGFVLGEWLGLIPPRLPEGIVPAAPLDGRYVATILTVYAILFGATAWLIGSLAAVLRASDRSLRQAYGALERVSRMRRDFLHIAIHNVKAPIGAATMLLRNLRDGLGGRLEGRQREWVERSLSRLERLGEFLLDLRLLAELEAGDFDRLTELVELEPLLEQLLSEYGELAETRDQRLELQVEARLPPVRGNTRLLREAIVNYLSNAIRYSPPGGRILVRAYRAPGVVRIAVRDDGVGIPREEQGRLFEEFTRISSAGEEGAQPRGGGLGLSIVRRVAEAHGGSVGFLSSPEAGSTFWLNLPAEDAAE